jgi:hypothetical protein
LTPRQQALFVGILVVAGVLWFISLQTTIPSGKENRAKAGAFLKEQFPDREVSPHDSKSPHDDPIAPVAVVYELIRSGEPEVARRAIGFAAEQQYGYAAPYVIGRLGSGDSELERAAQDYLRTIAGRDYGPDAASWRAWWRDPPRKLLGVASVGQTTLSIGIPAAMALAGVVLIAVCRLVGRWYAAAEFGPALVGFAWLMGCFVMELRIGLNLHTCTFGPSQITYYAGEGTVVGLEDARVGWTDPWILWFAVLVIGGLALVLACSAIVRGLRAQAASVPADRAGVG